MKIFLIFCTLFANLNLFAVTQESSKKMPDEPHIAFVKGKAFIYDANANEREAVKGGIIKQGEVIRTGEDSLLVIHIKDRVKIKVSPKTVIEVESLMEGKSVLDLGGKKEDNLFVHAGNIFVRFIKKMADGGEMQVKTKFTALGVRGTEFFVHLDPEDDRKYSMAVENGEVEVASSSSKVKVAGGQGTLLDPNGAMASAEKYEWVKELNWNFDPSQGSLATSEKVFQKIRKNWENYSKKVIEKRDSYFKSQKDKFNNMLKR